MDLQALTLTWNPDRDPGRAITAGAAQVLGQGGLPGVDLQAAPLDGKTKLALQAAVALMAVGGSVFGARPHAASAPYCGMKPGRHIAHHAIMHACRMKRNGCIHAWLGAKQPTNRKPYPNTLATGGLVWEALGRRARWRASHGNCIASLQLGPESHVARDTEGLSYGWVRDV